jgi:HPt (histidine-containing phosphotransfer) domain-containing protein
MESLINMEYLTKRTRSNPALMMEMISLYLDQTPPLLEMMHKGSADSDWDLVYQAVHKMIPSFTIMGIPERYESLARKIQENAYTRTGTGSLPAMIDELEQVGKAVCIALQVEKDRLNSSKS